jgi:allophanate hydrolase
MISDLPFDFRSLHDAYARGVAPAEVVREVYRRIRAAGDPGIFLMLREEEEVVAEADGLGRFDPARPLWGLPFCIKDNIDAGGLTTTAACPAYAYRPKEDAVCLAHLRGAGAVLIGKTNLDQFATGLVGVRTPYPVPLNAIDPAIVPGGSSSGSAVAVARGLVSFSLGTDTAGSGRVPAALNNIVGLKPSLGAVSARGVVPACRTLDTVSVFALTVEDAYAATRAMAHFDADDSYSRDIPFRPFSPMPPKFRVGVPSAATRRFFGDRVQADAFEANLETVRAFGGHVIELDFEPFYEVAALLYAGSWVAERYVTVAELFEADPGALHPATRDVVGTAREFSAADAFRHQYRLAEMKRELAPILASVDLLCLPSIPRFVRVAEIAEDPLGPNSELGTYTNFVNLLDLCGVAVPASARSDGRPGSVTVLAASGRDDLAAALARCLHRSADVCLGATDWRLGPKAKRVVSEPMPDEIELAVVGAHMSGLPLNCELTRLGARFLRATRTAPIYRLYALADGPPARPGLVRSEGGAPIEIETWAVPRTRFGDFIAGVPQPLGIGTLTLASNEQVKGFICEPAGLAGAADVTEYGGWRRYLSAKADLAEPL